MSSIQSQVKCIAIPLLIPPETPHLPSTPHSPLASQPESTTAAATTVAQQALGSVAAAFVVESIYNTPAARVQSLSPAAAFSLHSVVVVAAVGGARI